MNKTKIIALIGKSGAGKDTLLKDAIDSLSPDLHGIIKYTTRPKRENEIDNVDYHFMIDADFNAMQFLEFACFNNWYYGTAFESIEKDKVNIGVFSPEGVRQLLNHSDTLDIYPIYIIASDRTRLLRQLSREDNPNCQEIVRRFSADEADFSSLGFNAIVIVNEGEYNDALKSLLNFISLLINFGQKKLNINP